MTFLQRSLAYMGCDRWESFRKWVGGRWVKRDATFDSLYDTWEHVPEDRFVADLAYYMDDVFSDWGAPAPVLAVETWPVKLPQAKVRT